jgi:hypothetical protein
MGIPSNVRRAATERYRQAVAEDVWERLHHTPYHAANSDCFTLPKMRVSTQVLKRILLNHGDQSYFAGRQMVLKKRSMGAGIYELWLEPEKY